jgi:DNA-directed RNA polymerase specialized sigma24 family protein
VTPSAHDGFEEFFETAEPKLRRAFTALYGPDLAVDATAEALTWAFEHWDRVRDLDNPFGYLYRVGQSRTRRLRRRARFAWETTAFELPDFEPALLPALAALTDRQRICVVLVHGYGWPHADVAALLEIRTSTIATHVDRALERLRAQLEVYERD